MRRMLVNNRQPIFGFGDDICFMELRLGRAKKMMTLVVVLFSLCLLYTSPSPRDATLSRMPSSA
mgnify:CR=1 FL=1